jgi:hypothetical protein
MMEDQEKAKKYYGQAIKLNKNYEPAQQNMRRLFELENFGSSSEPFNLGEASSKGSRKLSLLWNYENCQIRME